MSVLTWLRRLSASPSDASAGRVADTRRSSSSSTRAAAGGLRRGAAPLLLGLPLLLGFAAPAAAQQLTISAPANTPEGNSGTRDYTFRVALSAAATDYVLFDVCFYSGTATIDMSGKATMAAGADYQPLVGGNPAKSPYRAYPRTMCVSSWIKTGDTSTDDIGIRVRGDTELEEDETVVATLELAGSPDGVTLGGTNPVTYTILNDENTDVQVWVHRNLDRSFNNPYQVIEGDSVTVEVRMSRAGTTATTFNINAIGWAVSGGLSGPIDAAAATDGGDFAPSGIRSVTIPADQTSTTIAFQAKADQVDENTEAFAVAIRNSSLPTGVVSTQDLALVYIIQPRVELKVFSNETRVVEGDSVPVVVSQPKKRSVDTEVVLAPAHIDTGSNDFPAANSGKLTVTISAGQKAGYGKFPTFDNSVSEPDEKFQIFIESGNAVAEGLNPFNVTIIDDDDLSNRLIVTSSTPTPFSEDEALALVEGGGGGFSVRLTTPPSGNVTVTISEESDPGNRIEFAGGTSQTTLPFTRENWHEEQTVSVRARQDPDEEGHVRYLTITPSGGGYPPIPVRFRVSVIDDDDDDGQNTPTVKVPDTQVANVEASVIDEESASVTWDAVEHATSYQVEWDSESTGGALPGVTGTTATIYHQAVEAVTLEIKVIPAYVDSVGATQLLDDLAGTTTLDVGPAPDPEISVSGGGDVTEGAAASFTVTASPAPSSSLTVDLTVSQSGDFAASGQTGSRQVEIPAAGSATVDVATDDDAVDEPNGSVSVAIDAGTGYTVAASPNDAATVAVRDDDDPPPATACVSDGQWNTVRGYYASNSTKANRNYGRPWYRVLIAYGRERTDKTLPDWVGATEKPTTPYTVAEALESEKVWSGWRPVRKVLECLEAGSSSSDARAPGATLDDDLERAFKLLEGVTPEEAAAALLGEPGLSAEQLNALDRLGNRNGRYDLGDMLSWDVRSRRAERSSNRPRRRRSGRDPRGRRPGGRQQSGRGRRRGGRGRPALAFLAVAALAWGCDGRPGVVEPSAAEPEPGFLAVELAAPAGARPGGAWLAIEGPDIGALRATGLEMFESGDGTRKEVIVAGALSPGRILEFRVPDRTLGSLYRVRLIEITGEDYEPADVSAYSTRVSR